MNKLNIENDPIYKDVTFKNIAEINIQLHIWLHKIYECKEKRM